MSTDVKSPRKYRSEQRSAEAAATRRRVLSAAAELFAAQGYGRTKMQEIADAAGVSVETVHLNGPKRRLLLAAFEQAFAGDDRRDPLMSRDEMRAIAAIEDNGQAIGAYLDFVAEANHRSTRLWCAFRSAADADPQIREDFDEVLQRRHDEYPTIMGLLSSRGLVAGGADVAKVGDALEFLLSPEGYEQLVLRAGWSVEEYREWLLPQALCVLGVPKLVP